MNNPPQRKIFDLLRPTGDAELDHAVMDLFTSGFFRRYLDITEQAFFIIDHRDMTYNFVSENIKTMSGYDAALFYEGGVNFCIDKYHESDLVHFQQFFPLMIESIGSLGAADIKRCKVSYNFRFRFADGSYHSVLQENIPLTVDGENKVVHGLAIIHALGVSTAIYPCWFRVVLYPDEGMPVVLREGGAAPFRLTRREQEVLKFITDGYSDRQIGEALNMSVYTVKTHRRNLLRKTSVRNSSALTRLAVAGLIVT